MSDPSIAPPVSASWFLTIFKVPRTWRFPEKFFPKNYSGMSLCQRVRGSSEIDLILIWWTGREAYKTYGPDQLRKDLGIAAVDQEGTVIQHLSTKKHWWQKPGSFIPWGVAILAGIAGVIGNLSQLEVLGGWLLASPKAEMFVSTQPVKCIKNEEHVIEFKIHNTSEGTCTLTNLEATANEPGVLVVERKLGPLAPLQSGELRSVSCQILPKSAGEHSITLSGEVRAGRLRRRTPLTVASIDLDVWPTFDWTPKITLQHADGKSASFLIEPKHGKPPTKIVRYQATAPENLGFICPEGVKLKTISHPGQGSSVIIWEQETIPLADQQVTLFVNDKTENSNERWKQYENQIKVTAEPAFAP